MTKPNQPPSPNDQRANQGNPNNPAHKAGQDNRANQLNPNNPAHQGGNNQSNKGTTNPSTPPKGR